MTFTPSTFCRSWGRGRGPDARVHRGNLFLMVDKLTTVPKEKLGGRVGRLGDADIVRLNQAMLVFLGLARSPVRGA
jgi:hypothetical protein